MLLSPVMDDHQAFPRIGGQQVLQDLRKLPLPQGGADMIVGAPGQRGHGTVDMHLGMVIPRGHLRHVSDHTPRGGQRRVAPHGCFIHDDQFPVFRLLGQQRLQLGPEGRLLLGLRFQVAVKQPAPATSALVPQLPPPLPTVLETNTGRHEVPHHFRGPHARVITQRSGTLADGLLNLRPLLHRESDGAPGDRRTLQPAEPRLVKRMNPSANGLLLPIQPLRHLGTALPVQQQQHAVVALAQPRIMCPTKGVPYLVAWDGSVRHRQQAQALPLLIFHSVIPWGLKNRYYFLGSL